MISKKYRILNLDVLIHSDSDKFVNIFDMDYSLFSVGTKSGNGQELRISYLDSRTLAVNGIAYDLEGSTDTLFLAYQTAIKHITHALKGFFIIHAGVVARNNEALIICGPPGSGKSTLVTVLIEAGFDFLSDDFCPIHKASHMVHPFPRTMWRAASEGDAFPEAAPEHTAFLPVRGVKHPVSFDGFSTRIARKPCMIKDLVYLDTGNPGNARNGLKVELLRAGEDVFLEAFASLKDVVIERVRCGLSIWKIWYPKESRITGEVIRLLSSLEPYVIDRYRITECTPDFTQAPSLTPVARHEAVHCLIGELKTDPGDMPSVKPGAYFMEANELLEGVNCYRLSAGRLDVMRTLLTELRTGRH